MAYWYFPSNDHGENKGINDSGVFDELKASRYELYNYSDCRWFKALIKACKNLKIELTEQSLENFDSYKTAQLLMDSPTMRALTYLAGGSEDED